MITKLSHVTLFVNNQEEAKNFYVNTLGFEVRTDHTMDGGFRWLTVGPPTQKDVDMVLMEPKPGPMLDEEAARAVRLLLKKGVLGSGVFEVDDCRKTYEDLKSKGVQFAGPTRRALLWHRSHHERWPGELVQHDAAQAPLAASIRCRRTPERITPVASR